MRHITPSLSCNQSYIWTVKSALIVSLIGFMSLGRAGDLSATETYDLKPTPSTGVIQQVRVNLEVKGKLKINADGKKVRTETLSVNGNLSYDEKLSPRPSMSAIRHYRRAEAKIDIGQNKLSSTLSDDCRLVGLAEQSGELTLFAVSSHLTRDELDLIDVPGNSAFVTQLLPGQSKMIGDKWPHSKDLLIKLFGLEAISQADVQSELKEVKDEVATIELSGSINGAVGGVATDLEVKAIYKFDLATSQITSLSMAIQENRSIGHAAPGFEVIAQLQMAIKRVERSDHLNESALSGVSFGSTAELKSLKLDAVNGGFRLLHGRGWQVMVNQPHVTVLRLIDRGDLLAQCNISRLADMPVGKTLSLEKFQSDVQKSLGKNLGQFVEATKSTGANGFQILRITAVGVASELPVQWIYYHLSDDQGRRVSFVFTLEQKLAERFAAADVVLTRSVELTGQSRPNSKDAPTPARPSAGRTTKKPEKGTAEKSRR